MSRSALSTSPGPQTNTTGEPFIRGFLQANWGFTRKSTTPCAHSCHLHCNWAALGAHEAALRCSCKQCCGGMLCH